MTFQEIKQAILEIKEIAYDDEAAHSQEDVLRERFIKYLARGYSRDLTSEEVQKYAKEILKTAKIDFERWCG